MQAAQKYGSDPSFDAWSRRTYGISGPALLAKVAKGESNDSMGAVSSAGARGGTQFMPATRQDYIARYGVDPWKSPDQAVHATELYLGHDKRGLAGYNPGDPSYTDYILGQKVGNVSGATGATTPSKLTAGTRTTTTTTPGVDNSATRQQLIGGFLSGGGVKSQNATLALASGWQAAQDVPGTTTTKTVKSAMAPPTSSKAVGGSLAASADKRADAINAEHLPYRFGGGHQGKTSIHAAVPLDCSGAVSKVLGINPRVASQFETWGSPGAGGDVTIYAKSTHVIMKIRDPKTGTWHFFGTSATNPGGGAGWIPQDAISPQYLQGFTARHA